MFQRHFPYFVPLKRVIPAIHLAVFRGSNGRFGSKLAGQDMLLLTTTGRKSGKRRTVPLLYVPDGDNYVIIGSNWAGPKHPLWVGNLLADSEAMVQVRSKRRRVSARVAAGAERERLWELVTGQYAEYNEYTRRIGGVREIALVVLTPRTAA